MELKQLRHFLAIVDHGSFSKAAIAIPISQPALTRSLQNLEASLGTELLERSTRGLLLTPAGEQLYQRAQLILNEVNKTKTEINSGKTDRPELNIGIAPLFSPAIMPRAIQEFTNTNSNCLLKVTRGLFSNLIQRVSAGELDGIFTNIPFSNLSDDLIIEPLFDISISYVCSASHPLARSKSVQFDDLKTYPWAVVDEDSSNEIYRHIFANEGVVKDPISLKTNSLALLKTLVLEPPFITILPQHLVERDVRQNTLKILNIKSAELKRKGGLIYRKDSIETDYRTALFKAIRRSCEQAKSSSL